MRKQDWKEHDPRDQAIVILSRIVNRIVLCADGYITPKGLEADFWPLYKDLSDLQDNYMQKKWRTND